MTALRIPSGGVEALKWFALVAMTGDHINAFFFARELPLLTELGRLAMPLFGIVIAYNLARTGVQYTPTLLRLLALGLLAWPGHGYLFGYGLPLNIMFTFAAAVASLAVWDRSPFVALTLAVLAGPVVEFAWPGIAIVLTARWYFRTGTADAALAAVASVASLWLVNGSHWGLLAVPLVLLVALQAPTMPRAAWAFRFYYPAHLAFFAVAAWVLGVQS